MERILLSHKNKWEAKMNGSVDGGGGGDGKDDGGDGDGADKDAGRGESGQHREHLRTCQAFYMHDLLCTSWDSEEVSIDLIPNLKMKKIKLGKFQ